MKKMLLLTAAVLFLATGCSTTNTQKNYKQFTRYQQK